MGWMGNPPSPEFPNPAIPIPTVQLSATFPSATFLPSFSYANYNFVGGPRFGRFLLAATKVEINLIICWTRNAVAFAQLHRLAFILLSLFLFADSRWLLRLG